MATETKTLGFTPGPWKCETTCRIPSHEHEDGFPVFSGKRGGFARIANVRHCQSKPGKEADSVDIANARLIAAAPDLYAALAEIVERFDKHDATDALEAIDTVARAALAAAKGGA